MSQGSPNSLLHTRGLQVIDNMKDIVILLTQGASEVLTRDASPSDILHYYKLAVARGSVGISVHAEGRNGVYVTSEQEAKNLTARCLSA